MRNMKRWLAVMMSATMAFGGAGVAQLSSVTAFAEDNSSVVIDKSDAETATHSVSWATDYTTVTIDGKTYDTKRTFGEDGAITVTPQTKKSTVIGETDDVPPAGITYRYFDLENSKLVYTDGNVELNNKTFTYEKASSLFNGESVVNVALQLVQPDYTKEKASDTAKTYTVPGMQIGPWVIEIKADPNKLDATATADQTVTFTVDTKLQNSSTEVKGESGTEDRYGKAASAKITVQKNNAVNNPTEIASKDFFYDSTTGNGVGTTLPVYDGGEHKIVSGDYTGWTAAYTIYNQETGKYDNASSVSVNHVQKENIKVRATLTKDKNVKSYDFNVNLSPAQAVFGFDLDASVADKTCEYNVSGAEYKASDYIVVKAADNNDKDIAAAYKKAVTADEKTLKAFFDEVYTINETTTKADPDVVELEIQPKVLDAKDKKTAEITEKYAELMRDYGIADLSVATLNSLLNETNATINLNHKQMIRVYVDQASVEEGTAPTLKYTVYTVNENNYRETLAADFDKSLLKFTSIGGEELTNLKPGTYKLAATADGYDVEVYAPENGTYGILTVTAKAAEKTPEKTPTKATLKTAKITKVALAKKAFKAKALKKKAQKTTVKVTKTGNGKLTIAKASGNKKIAVTKAGKVTLKKGLKKGTYKIKVKVTAAKTSTYKAATKTATLTIKVK